MLDAAYQVMQRHGVYAASQFAAYRSLQRLIPMDVRHFMIQDLQLVRNVERRSNVDCLFLTSAEVREFARDPSNDLSAEIADRLDGRHDLCFAGIVDGRLACYCWYAFHSIEAEHNSSHGDPAFGIAISFPEEYVFRYKGFTHPEFRGQQLYSVLASQAAGHLRDHGVSFVLSATEWVHFNELKSCYRSKFDYVGIAAVAEFGGRRFVRYPSMPDVDFDEDAEVLERSELRLYRSYPSDSNDSSWQQTGALR